MSDLPVLNLAGTYQRRVNASISRIWENVFDWEHLAHLHNGSFACCRLVDCGAWGWRVELTELGGSTAQLIELRADRVTNDYTVTTIEGIGVGTEIRVSLSPRGKDQVDVGVEFHVPESRPNRLTAIGDAYAATYARLWDEDEAMMRIRERALGQRLKPDLTAPPLDLGDEQVVRAALPIVFELGGASFRLVNVGAGLFAHSTICPHWLGPLDDVPVIDGVVRCPWHGYRFEVASGACPDHPALKLSVAAHIRIVEGRVIAAFTSNSVDA